MTPVAEVHTVAPETSTSEAIRLMRRFRVGCLAVVSEGRLVGLVSEEEFVNVAGRLLGNNDDDENA